MSDLTPKAGDVNGDGVVNMIDLSLVSKNYGVTGATHAQGDVVGDPDNTGITRTSTPDGAVNIDDLSIVSANYAP